MYMRKPGKSHFGILMLNSSITVFVESLLGGSWLMRSALWLILDFLAFSCGQFLWDTSPGSRKKSQICIPLFFFHAVVYEASKTGTDFLSSCISWPNVTNASSHLRPAGMNHGILICMSLPNFSARHQKWLWAYHRLLRLLKFENDVNTASAPSFPKVFTRV